MMASGESRHSRIGLRASVTVLALPWSCEASGFYRGVVLDAETNERLAGVVVVVLWQKKPIICMDCPLYFQGQLSSDAQWGHPAHRRIGRFVQCAVLENAYALRRRTCGSFACREAGTRATPSTAVPSRCAQDPGERGPR